MPWSYEVQSSGGDAVLHPSVNCLRSPFRVEREMRLPTGESRLILREKVTNLSSEAAHFVWGTTSRWAETSSRKGARSTSRCWTSTLPKSSMSRSRRS